MVVIPSILLLLLYGGHAGVSLPAIIVPHRIIRVGTLAVDGWAVTFGTARRGVGGLTGNMICREPELCRVNALHNDDMRSRPCTNRCKCDADADATTATSHQRQRRTLSRRLVGQLRGCQPAAGRRAGERPATACSRRPAGHDRQRRGPRQSLGDGDHWRQFSAASDRVRRTHRAREHTT